MATSETRLKEKIIAVMDECSVEEDSPETSKELFAEKLAQAVIFEIKNMTITATAPNGVVTIIKIE